jgi:hypothetical protein
MIKMNFKKNGANRLSQGVARRKAASKAKKLQWKKATQTI